eukprot:m.57122 g.57122  ORF g.57122 m.57122 type:complete len:94 (-) comp7730_c0_seq1:207-488(-)
MSLVGDQQAMTEANKVPTAQPMGMPSVVPTASRPTDASSCPRTAAAPTARPMDLTSTSPNVHTSPLASMSSRPTDASATMPTATCVNFCNGSE